MPPNFRIHSSTTEPDDSDRFDALAVRAARAGYLLVQNWPNSHHWHLLDATDNETLYTAPTLDAVERWLDG